MPHRLSRRRFLQTTAAGAALGLTARLPAADEKKPAANDRRAVELVQSGAIGPVREVHVWCGKSWGGTGQKPPTPPVPDGLDYEMWVGPAPFRPFSPAWVPYEWRRWWDFGGGTMADM